MSRGKSCSHVFSLLLSFGWSQNQKTFYKVLWLWCCATRYRVDWKKVVWKNMFLKDIANGMLTVEPEKSESGSRKCTFPFSNTIWQRSLSSAFCTHMMGSTENLSCENLKLRKSCKSVYMFVYVYICVNMCILCTCVQYITLCATMNSINRLLS